LPRAGVAVALILTAGILAYANSLSAPFLFDDESSIVENPAIRSFETVFAERFNSPLSGRPVVGVTFALNFALGGLEVAGYHAANVAVHLCSALVLFGLIRRSMALPRLQGSYGPRAMDLAAAVAVLWTIHPLNTEAVNYVTQRTELLFGFFYLLTLYAVVRSHFSSRPLVWYGLAVLACALGMASKESMVTAPLMVLLYERVFVYRSWREMFSSRSRVYFYDALALTWVLLAALVVPGPRSSSAGFSTDVSVWTYLLNQTVMITRYLRLAVWPAGLVVNYGPPVPLTLPAVLPQALVVMTLLIGTLIALVRVPPLGFLGAWFFMTLAPTSSFLPIATEVGAERRMYLPLVAVVATFVIGIFTISRIRERVPARIARIAVVGVAMALGIVTMARNREYASRLSIAQMDLRRWPNDYTHGAVGSELARLGRDEEAIAELRLGARSDPRARYNLGVSLFNTKRYEEAIRELDLLAAAHPWREEVPWSRRVMGHAYAIGHKWPEAITQLRMVLAMTPGDRRARDLLINALDGHGIELGSHGKFPEALATFRRALELDPKNASARHNLATALLDSGDPDGALTEAQHAMLLNPTYAGTHNLIGRALALQGKYPEAVAALERAVALDPRDAEIQNDLQRVRAVIRQR
jgi:Flp pilus assembly protein TadD